MTSPLVSQGDSHQRGHQSNAIDRMQHLVLTRRDRVVRHNKSLFGRKNILKSFGSYFLERRY